MTTHLIQAALDGMDVTIKRHPDHPTSVLIVASYNDKFVTRVVDRVSILRDRADLLDGTIALMRNELAAQFGMTPACPHCCQRCDDDLCFHCGLDPRKEPSADYPPVRPLRCTWSFVDGRWKRDSGPEAYLLEQ